MMNIFNQNSSFMVKKKMSKFIDLCVLSFISCFVLVSV